MSSPEPLTARLHRRRWAAAAAAGSLLAAWLTAVAVVPRYADALSRWHVWHTQRQRLAAVVDWEVERTHLGARQLYLQQYFESLYVSLPRSDQMSAILQTLQQHAAALEVRLEQVRQGDRVAHATFDELPVEVELRGTFHGIGAFVDEVERSPLLMKVGAIDVEVGGWPGASPRASLKATLVLFVIILKEQQP